MGIWKNLKIGKKLDVLTAVAVLGLLIFAALAFHTISQIQVGSDFFAQKRMSNSVAADFENPPQSLQKVYSLAVEAEDAPTQAERESFIAQIRSARKDYEGGHQHYVETLPPGPLHDLVAGPSNTSTEAWYDAAEQEFFPALAAGDRARATAARTGPMEAAYRIDAAAVDEITRLTNAWDTENDRQATVLVASKTHMMEVAAGVILLALIALGAWIGRGISRPLGQLATAAHHISLGDVSVQVEYRCGDEVGSLADSFRELLEYIRGVSNGLEKVALGDLSAVIEARSNRDMLAKSYARTVAAVNALTRDMNTLSDAAVQGTLSARVDAGQHEGEYRKVAEGVNRTLNAVIGPLNVAADYMLRISNGNIPAKITETYNGEFDTLKTSVNTCIDAVNALVEDAAMLACAAAEGRLDVRADAARHHGDFRRTIEGVNQTLNAVIGPLNVATDYMQRISNGNIPAKITETYLGDFDTLKGSLNTCIDAVNALVEDAAMLASAALEGKLDVRADAARHHGDFRKTIEGVNRTMNAVIGPLHVAADYVDRIGKGDIPPRITESYRGDFETLKHSLNACIDGLGGLEEVNGVLQRMAVNDCTVDVTGVYQGIFAEVARATNQAQERSRHIAVLVQMIGAGDYQEELQSMKAIRRRSENDALVPAFVQTMSSIDALVRDADMLAEAAAKGLMNTRADASRHQGDYRRVIEGMNRTLEAIVAPLKATSESASTLASSSEELTAVSQGMASTAEETATQANVVSAASEQVSRNIASVATASEQMQSTIREISKSANDSARVASTAVEMAQSTNDTMRKLGDSSQEIGNVIKVITSIAQQTNLLALNATIEAARAGEAGKGFAVVANEVKELAKQTAKATEEISEKIEASQQVTMGAVTAIEEIGAIINQISDISNSIASAVEEQTVTTNEIGRSVADAAQGISDIAKNIGGVATSARNTTQGANDTKSASLALSEMAARLHSAVSEFKF
ncbi:MAG: methyl-accepting chemotaxis protein [Terracidiphilus sp.]